MIVIISLIPADNTELALVARLVRVFRVLRMISIIPELRILLVSLIKAMPQLGYVMLLMFISTLFDANRIINNTSQYHKNFIEADLPESLRDGNKEG